LINGHDTNTNRPTRAGVTEWALFEVVLVPMIEIGGPRWLGSQNTFRVPRPACAFGAKNPEGGYRSRRCRQQPTAAPGALGLNKAVAWLASIEFCVDDAAGAAFHEMPKRVARFIDRANVSPENVTFASTAN
jgi:hypothetical protein